MPPNDMIETLNRLAGKIHKTAIEHGWWETERELPEVLMLCVSELSEALEEYRDGRPNEWYMCNEIFGDSTPCLPKDETQWRMFGHTAECEYRSAKPEGIAVAMVDCIIRIFDYLAHIDIDGIMKCKMKYNASRPYRHGGKKC